MGWRLAVRSVNSDQELAFRNKGWISFILNKNPPFSRSTKVKSDGLARENLSDEPLGFS
jgi:hypothetical protein